VPYVEVVRVPLEQLVSKVTEVRLVTLVQLVLQVFMLTGSIDEVSNHLAVQVNYHAVMSTFNYSR